MANHSYVNAVARQSGSNFYFSFFSLPKEKREAITAVYAFCRQVDDAVDALGQQDPAAEVARWREEIARTYEGEPSLSLTRSLAQAIDRFDLSRAYFEGILTGVGMDIATRRYPTFEALQGYCYHVAGEVGLLCMEIFGYRSERLKSYAVKLGTAFQLTNILRDVKTDAERGRIYIPQEDLRRFGVSEEWILQQASPSPGPTDGLWGLPSPLSRERANQGSSSVSPLQTLRHYVSADAPTPPWREGRGIGGEGGAFSRLMAFETRRARDFYREAAVLPTAEERPSLRAAEIMRAIYENILDRIERKNFNVFARRVRVPTPVKLWLALKTYWASR